METAAPEVYVEDILLHGLTQAQHVAIVQNAIYSLNWPLTAHTDKNISCFSINGNEIGEYINIKLSDGSARISSRPANEYYFDEGILLRNIRLLKTSIEKLAEESRIADRNLHPMHREKLGALVPSKSYLVTPLLVYINAAVLLLMVLTGISFLHPTAQELFLWGGNLRPATVHGQWWRLFTYMFLHAGILHFATNSFGLLYIGMFLEPMIGKLRFAASYLFTGIGAGLLSIIMHADSVGVGASGAIFGMYGVFLALLTTGYLKKTYRKTMLRSILFFVLLNLMYGLQGNIDNAAHIGGLVSGFFIGRLYYPGLSKYHDPARQWRTTIAISVGFMVIAAFVFTSLH
ncbi:MAG: rhomboid family intramembrane serine protease [Bacteroidetes bacterium]|nr:rhomboid family intramembrane serine protease [Bacteroidota bacterium]